MSETERRQAPTLISESALVGALSRTSDPPDKMTIAKFSTASGQDDHREIFHSMFLARTYDPQKSVTIAKFPTASPQGSLLVPGELLWDNYWKFWFGSFGFGKFWFWTERRDRARTSADKRGL